MIRWGTPKWLLPSCCHLSLCMQTDKVLLWPHSKINCRNTPSEMSVKIYLTVQVLPRQNATNLMARSHVSEHQYVNNFFYMYCESFINFGDIKSLTWKQWNTHTLTIRPSSHTVVFFFSGSTHTRPAGSWVFLYITYCDTKLTLLYECMYNLFINTGIISI